MFRTDKLAKLKILLFRVEYFISTLCYYLSNTLLKISNGLLFNKNLNSPTNILIFRTGNLGDTICAIPAIQTIKKRFAKSRFILMTAEKIQGLPHPYEVLGGLLTLDEILIYKPTSFKNIKYFFYLVKSLRNKNVDLLIYLSQSDTSLYRFLRDMVFFKLAGCKKNCGFQLTKHYLFRKAQRHYKHFDNEVNRLISLLSPLNIKQNLCWEIPKANLDLLWPQELNSRFFVSIHPTAKFPVKKWPIHRFLEIARRLRDRYHPLVVMVGDREAQGVTEAFRKELGNDVLDLTGKTSFLQLAEVLRRCDLLISNDSGPAHVAAAVGTPVVGIYSARDFPKCWYPWGEQHKILRKDVPCQICLKTECETMECIRNITIEEVFSACDEIMSRNPKMVILENKRQTDEL